MIAFCDFIGGFVAGMLGVTVGHPIDTIKTQQQTQNFRFFQASKYIYTQRGWRGYFRGMSIPLLTSGALNSLFFGVYSAVLDRMEKNRQDPFLGSQNGQITNELKDITSSGHGKENSTYGEIFLAGSIAGTLTMLCSCPTDLVKVKLQDQMKVKVIEGPVYKGPIDVITRIVREAGPRAMFRGLSPMIIRDVLPYGYHMLSYEFIKRHLQPIDAKLNDKLHLFSKLMAGGISGLTAWWLIIPFDLIKTKMQADDHKNPKIKNSKDSITVLSLALTNTVKTVQIWCIPFLYLRSEHFYILSSNTRASIALKRFQSC